MFVLYFLTICNLINNTLEISAKISADIFISIHTSAREVTIQMVGSTSMSGFQSTLPQGKWQKDGINICKESLFQSTLPQGKWHITFSEFLKHYVFQSTLPQGKWRGEINTYYGDGTDFNPHFRKGSDDFRSVITVPGTQISIHTSAREVTGSRYNQSRHPSDFNPHFRKGSDYSVGNCDNRV